LLGCGFDDGKAAASRRTPKCPHGAAAGGPGYRENCELEFAMPKIKKRQRSCRIEKNRTLTQKVEYQMKYGESKGFLVGLASDQRANQALERISSPLLTSKQSAVEMVNLSTNRSSLSAAS